MNYNFKFQEKMKNIIISRGNNIFRKMKEKKLDFDDFLEMKQTYIYDSKEYQELSVSNKNYVSGYMDAIYNDLWSNNMEWMLYHPDMGLIISEEVPHGDWYKIISEKSCFCWKGTKKVFYTSQKEMPVPVISVPEHLTWNDVVNGDVIFDKTVSKPFNGPFIIEDVDRQYLLNPYNQRFFCHIHLKNYVKKVDEEYIVIKSV